jgi:SAM-dependent methyltransferase
MTAKVIDGARRYLDVRYAEAARPYTAYPEQLTRYLTERYLPGRRGQRLLDLGCGRGEFLHGFALEGFDAIGIDRSRPSAPRFSEPVVVGDYERSGLPFGDGEMQVIFSKSVLEHVFEVGSHGFVIREATRFRQLPFLWQRPWLRPVADAAALLPNGFKRHKLVRFSKEWMLLVVADRD